MRLGMCTNPDNVELAARSGFDYIEISLSWLQALSEEAYQALLTKAPSFPLPMPKANCFLPANMPITGPMADPVQQAAYVSQAFARASALGVKLVVFGSNAARNVPEGADYAEGWRQIDAFLRLCIPYCLQYDITIAIEPLRRASANVLNLVSEAQILAALIHHPKITVLGDTFHMLNAHEPWDALTKAGSLLTHVHISQTVPDLSTRFVPAPDDGNDYAAILDTLKAMGYPGDVSVEAGAKDAEKDWPLAAALLRRLM